MMVENINMTCLICDGQYKLLFESMVDDRYGCPGQYSICECESCGFCSILPRLKEEDLPSLYSQFYPRNAPDLHAIDLEVCARKGLLAKIRRRLNGTDNQGQYLAKEGQVVLDLGCGSCQTLLELRDMKTQAYGIEADPNVRVISDHFGLQVHIGNVLDNPFPGVQFDLIIMNQVIEHIPQPKETLRLLKERLTPTGQIVLSFPNPGSIYKKLTGRYWVNWHVPYHQSHFTLNSIQYLARQLDMKISNVKYRTPDLWTFIQLRSIWVKQIEGKPSEVWSGLKTNDINRFGFKRNIARFRKLLTLLALPFLSVINRLIDIMRAGDSLLVVLNKKL